MKRYYSLYYGSISIVKCISGVANAIAGLFVSTAQRRNSLTKVVKQHFPMASVFAFGSARSALAACLTSAGIGKGDDVLLSAYTCIAVPTGVIAAGARPVYMDIDSETLNTDINLWANNVFTDKVKAIVVQHTLGKPALIEEICAIAQKKNVLVIEDCALSIGSSKNGRLLGSFGDAAIISMELSKTMTCGWGGLLLVNNQPLTKKATDYYQTVPEHGFIASAKDHFQTLVSAICHRSGFFFIGKYVLHIGFRTGLFRRSTPEHEYLGIVDSKFLVRMGHFQLGLARKQWNDLETLISKSLYNADILRRQLSTLNIQMPGVPGQNEVLVTPRVSFLVKDRSLAVTYFANNGIELGEWFDGPLSPEPQTDNFNYRKEDYPNAAKVARHVANLPCNTRLTKNDMQYICSVLSNFAKDCPNNYYQYSTNQIIHYA